MTATAPGADGTEDLYRIERVMSVFAHPDDAEFGCSGTLARFAAEGIEVTVVVCTAGNRGGEGERTEEELAAVRELEQAAANKILGITNYVNLGYDDGSLTPSLELRKDITRVIRQHRPNIVICGNPVRNLRSVGGNHPDHLAAAEATFAAIYPTARNPMALPELRQEGLEKWVVNWIYVTGTTLEKPNHYEDISATLEQKANALAAHQSQLGDWVHEYARTDAEEAAQRAEKAGFPGLKYAEEFFRLYSGEQKTKEAAALARAQRFPEERA
ncbi:MAG TPA: PIG-L deacetylase family protein [Candidatus Solibacter sp.]|jgi:LmbE family N-acetylglucosaminyl deacetylase|nr:PIG-L deacetylase family protein [Candidatus Solibacter sp.]